MSRDDTIMTSLLYERAAMCGSWAGDLANSADGESIEFYGRRMLKLEKKKRIKSTDTDEQIAKAITPIMAWLFWQIAPELLMWIVEAIRKRIWQQEPQQ
jgi:site-specific DNA-cytosine methylase